MVRSGYDLGGSEFIPTSHVLEKGNGSRRVLNILCDSIEDPTAYTI